MDRVETYRNLWTQNSSGRVHIWETDSLDVYLQEKCDEPTRQKHQNKQSDLGIYWPWWIWLYISDIVPSTLYSILSELLVDGDSSG